MKTTNLKNTLKIAGLLLTLLFSTDVNAQTCPSWTLQGSDLKFSWGSAADAPATISSIDYVNTDSTALNQSGVVGSLHPNNKIWTTSTGTFNTAHQAGSGRIYFNYSGGVLACGFSSGALPIELMYFKGELVNGNNILTWATASEQNNSHFTIEKSTDNVNWTVVNVTNGAGNSINTIKYDVTDYQTTNGTVYYRLRQDDYNGDYTYSNTIAMENNADTEFEIMGMFVDNNTLTVSFTSEVPAENIEIQIVSLSGAVQSVITVNSNSFNGTHVNLNISELKGGVYSITIRSGNNITSSKFIK